MRNLIYILVMLAPVFCGAQCDMDKHNTSLESGWRSCTTNPNPNPSRNAGHWIMYDFTFDYSIGQLHFWNYNHPDSLNQGAQSVSIDISQDGINWTSATDFTLPMASGESDYEGIDGPILNQRARFMLLTMNSNYGGSCTAISEVRIGVADEIDCPSTYTFNGATSNKKYYAINDINAQGTVASDQIIHLQAGQTVNIDPGFEAATTAEFEVAIAPCDQ